MKYIFALIFSFFTSAQAQELQTVSKLDVKRYMGTWYEVARLPAWFQDKCKAETSKADYSLKLNGEIKVVNSCVTHDGKETSAEGVAWQPDADQPGQLKVSFMPILKHLHMFGGDYWIIELADDYSYVMVGSPDRKYLWIMARDRNLNHNITARLVDKAKALGYPIERLVD